MSTLNDNKSITFFRTQSYIANGMPNPTFKTSNKDYLSSLIRNKYGKKVEAKPKTKKGNNKDYIKEIKKSKNKNQKITSLQKPTQKKLLDNYINNKLDEKTEINNKKKNKLSRNTLIYNTKTEKFKSINENYLYSKTHHQPVKNNDNNFKGKENNKNEMNILGHKRTYINENLSNNGANKSNGFIKTNNLNEEFFSKTNKAKGGIKFDYSDLVHRSNLGYMTTRLNLNSRNKDFKKNIDNIYDITYRSKLNKNKKKFTSFQKDSKFISKILSKDNDDYLDIKNHRNKNVLINKFNLYSKRENLNLEENKTQKGLLTIKHLINKKFLFSPKSATNKTHNKSINCFHKSLSNFKQHNKYLNYLSRNKELSPVLTEYNIKKTNNNNKISPSIDLFKTKIGKSISKIINSIREDRKTCKFIKELNKVKKLGNNSNNNIRFSFSRNEEENIEDEFFSPNKSKINIIQFKESKKMNNNKKINYFIKKNISSDNFKGYSTTKNKYNAINRKINNFINSYKAKSNVIMPANEAT